MENRPILLENEAFRLLLSPDGTTKSLILKKGNRECLANAETPFCTLTEERPYHNEVKLAFPTKETVFSSCRLRLEGNRLIVGFEKLHFEAVVEVEIAPRYMVFSLVDFLVREDSFGMGVAPILPPVKAFRLVQLPIVKKEHFGEWLNVVWGDDAAVNLLSACPFAKVGSEDRRDHRILFGETLREVQLKQAGVALIVSEPGELLDGIEALEEDKDLPRGVASRRSAEINRSYYWTRELHPHNVEEQIEIAKKGGFRYVLVYYSAFLEESGGFRKTGNYRIFRKEYPKGREDLIFVLDRIKAAGLHPGLHLLHSHVGMQSRFLTPVADHRVNLTRHFTLAAPCSREDTEIVVEENPEGSPLYEKMRVLRFMGELIQYESYTTERPYRFLGCRRGFNETLPRAHEIGTIGGVLDVSEFLSNSAYVDQKTSLQDELAEEIADLYHAGFEFLYFDGSEGVSPPFDLNVGLAQWRVYRRLKKKPIFCEGAAKSNFSWHMLSGGNAFDLWKPQEFKTMILEHPLREAERMKADFTRVNFGWWECAPGQRPDIIELGTAKAASQNCPGAFRANGEKMKATPRREDILETLRRWEEARISGFLTEEKKKELRDPRWEHTLLLDEKGDFELVRWEEVKGAAEGNPAVSAFLFRRNGTWGAVLWNNEGEGFLSVPFGKEGIFYYEELGSDPLAVVQKGEDHILPLGKKRYLMTNLSKEALRGALENSRYLSEIADGKDQKNEV